MPKAGRSDVPVAPTLDSPFEITLLDERDMKNLAPSICRQRMVIEGIPTQPISAVKIVEYLSLLSIELKMIELLKPVTHKSETFGWAGWIHWETSGAHFYAWEQPLLFFSVDIYTCKEFSEPAAIAFTRQYFEAVEIEHKSV